MFLPLYGVPLTDDRKRKCAKVLRDAVTLDRRTLDQAAQEADRDVRQFARQLAGEEGSIPSLMKQPDSWWSWFGVCVLKEFGFPEEFKVAARARRHMVKMRITAQKERQAS